MTRIDIGPDTPPADPIPDVPRGLEHHGRPVRTRSGTRLGATGAGAGRLASTWRPLDLALVQLSLAALLCGVVELAFAWHERSWFAAAVVVSAWVYVAAGALAWSRRPSNGLGCLIVVGGLVLLVNNLNVTQLEPLVALSLIFATASLTIVVHILLAFPSGRLDSTAARVTVAAGYVVCFVLQAPLYVFAVAPAPYDVLTVADRPDLVQLGQQVQTAAGVCVMVSAMVVLAGRLRTADPRRRRWLAPLYGYGILAALFIPLAPNVLWPALGLSYTTVSAMQLIDLVGVPVAFVLSLLRGGFARTGEIQELATWLSGADGGRVPLATAVKRALGDDSVRLLFRRSHLGGYVDADGMSVDDPGSAGRAVVDVTVGGERIGAIDYDPTLNADPDLVRSAGRVVAVALDRERVSAELRASQRDLRRSRIRIVEAGDAERRRITRDLHDGLQVRLVLLALEAQQLADAASSPTGRTAALALRAGIDAAAAESRGLVQAVLPAALVQGGLGVAAEDLVDRVPVPTRLHVDLGDASLPAVVESTAYFVVAEALSNALKHARPRGLTVRLARTTDLLLVEVTDDGVGGARVGRGTGLRGLEDRVDAVGGRLRVVSAPGGGTRVVASLPCDPDVGEVCAVRASTA